MFGYFFSNALSIAVIAVTAGGFTQVVIFSGPAPLLFDPDDPPQAARPTAARPTALMAARLRHAVLCFLPVGLVPLCIVTSAFCRRSSHVVWHSAGGSGTRPRRCYRLGLGGCLIPLRCATRRGW